MIILRKEILHIGICYLEGSRLEKVKEYLVNFADSLATAPLIQDLIDQTGIRRGVERKSPAGVLPSEERYHSILSQVIISRSSQRVRRTFCQSARVQCFAKTLPLAAGDVAIETIGPRLLICINSGIGGMDHRAKKKYYIGT